MFHVKQSVHHIDVERPRPLQAIMVQERAEGYETAQLPQVIHNRNS